MGAPRRKPRVEPPGDAPGLVRSAGPWSVLILNLHVVSVGVLTLVATQTIRPLYPGANLPVTFLVALALVLPTGLVFAMASAAMPRSGGDHPFVGRVLGPTWGMVSSFNQTVWWIVSGAVPAILFARVGLPSLFRTVGVLAGEPGLVGLGNRFAIPNRTFAVGAFLIAATVAVLALGNAAYFRLQNLAFAVAVGATILTLAAFALRGPAEFRAGFNEAAAALSGKQDTAAAILRTAREDGFRTGAFSPFWSVIAVTWLYLRLAFAHVSAYIGGEVERPARVQLRTIPAAAALSAIVAALTVWLAGRSVGPELLGALGFDDGATLGLDRAPPYPELAAYGLGNAAVGVLVTAGFLVWSASWLPGQLLAGSRNLLAYGVDGVLPGWFARVHPRRHVPVNALVTIGAGSIAVLWFASRSDVDPLILLGILGFVLSFVVTSVAAVAFPSRCREEFEASAVARRVGGVPVISIVGGLSILACAFMAWAYLADPLSGITWRPREPGFAALLLTLGIFASGAVVSRVSRWVRGRRGIDRVRVARELPRE